MKAEVLNSILCKAKITVSFCQAYYLGILFFRYQVELICYPYQKKKKIILIYYVNELLIHHGLIQLFKILYNRLKLKKTYVPTFSLDVPNVTTFPRQALGLWKGGDCSGLPGKDLCCLCCGDMTQLTLCCFSYQRTAIFISIYLKKSAKISNVNLLGRAYNLEYKKDNRKTIVWLCFQL